MNNMEPQITTLDPELFAKMILIGASNLKANCESVNALNVFPIPDGDTGDNMFMTINSGIDKIKKDYSNISDISRDVSKGMLIGARGNSGVILSRIFAGIANGLSNLTYAAPDDFCRALQMGVDEAYKAVSVPVEGTMLTVIRESVKCASDHLTDTSTFESLITDLADEMENSLERTPELLDVLREAGVVDSGGAGLLYIFRGMKKAVLGDEIYQRQISASGKNGVDISKFTENDVMTYGYCTEFLLRLTKSKIDIPSFNEGILLDFLKDNGESVAFFRDGTVIKAHVHTKNPGDILNEALKYGEFLSVKIENMNLQHNETVDENKNKTVKHKQYGIVAVSSGKGIKDTFKSLGVDEVVDGGQSMNPSAGDLISAFEKVNADTIFVFPNNSNVIMTALQAADLYVSADVRVIPTKNIGECYSAVSMFDTSSKNTDQIVSELNDIISNTLTGSVSMASRNAVMDGVNIKEGRYIGFTHDKILSCEEDKNQALVKLLTSLEAGKFDILLLIYGESTSNKEAEKVKDIVSCSFPNCEVYLINGGQPVFDYQITLE